MMLTGCDSLVWLFISWWWWWAWWWAWWLCMECMVIDRQTVGRMWWHAAQTLCSWTHNYSDIIHGHESAVLCDQLISDSEACAHQSQSQPLIHSLPPQSIIIVIMHLLVHLHGCVLWSASSCISSYVDSQSVIIMLSICVVSYCSYSIMIWSWAWRHSFNGARAIDNSAVVQWIMHM